MITRTGTFLGLFALLFSIALMGCGGGGSSAPPDPTPKITSVTVNCAPTSVSTGQKSQCSANVQGTGAYSSAVTWAASAGTISNSGEFTAPSSAAQVTITATSAADGTKSGSTTVAVTVPATVTSVTVNCAPTSVSTGQKSQCSANVQGTGAYSSAVSWGASAGTISSSGEFTAPSSAAQVTITATSAADGTKSGSTTVAVTVPATITSVTVTCASNSVSTGQTDQCYANVQGTGSFDSSVKWDASAGSVSNSGMFTAPLTAGQVTVTASSVADTSKSGSKTIIVTSTITGVTLSCPESSLPEGLTEQCTATVQGTGTYNTSVTWQASKGTISSGLFSAPTVSGDVTITATAAGDSTKAATKTITITAPQKAGFEYEGINHVSWWNDEYTYGTAVTSENALAATGANYAGVLVTQYMPTYTATTIAPSLTRTPSDTAVVAAIRQLHSQGVKVMLKPHVDVSDGNWRGVIAPTNAAAWFASYKTFITHYAQLAQDNNVEMLCIGTELKTMSSGAYVASWTDVINAIRAVYTTGKLTYAANAVSAGDEFTTISFWNQLDIIGLDGYFPLTNHNDPTITELVAAWTSNASGLRIVDLVKNFANAYPTKPIIFTEIGYRSAAGANKAPWDYVQTSTADNMEQQNCYEAMYRVWSGPGSVVKGHFWWAWPVLSPGTGDTDYNPRSKPAQTVLQNWQ